MSFSIPQLVLYARLMLATSILGIISFLFGAFFFSMAATIKFGLGFATILTLIVEPVIYMPQEKYRTKS